MANIPVVTTPETKHAIFTVDQLQTLHAALRASGVSLAEVLLVLHARPKSLKVLARP